MASSSTSESDSLPVSSACKAQRWYESQSRRLNNEGENFFPRFAIFLLVAPPCKKSYVRPCNSGSLHFDQGKAGRNFYGTTRQVDSPPRTIPTSVVVLPVASNLRCNVVKTMLQNFAESNIFNNTMPSQGIDYSPKQTGRR